MDFMSEMLLARILRNIREIHGDDVISVELQAAAEYFAYGTIATHYAMLRGIIPRRYLSTDKTGMDLYLPEPLLQFFRKKKT